MRMGRKRIKYFFHGKREIRVRSYMLKKEMKLVVMITPSHVEPKNVTEIVDYGMR